VLERELVRTLDAQTTRRRVLKTGAKLAYAAPLVAATTKLTGGVTLAEAISGAPTCQPAGGPCACDPFACCSQACRCSVNGQVINQCF